MTGRQQRIFHPAVWVGRAIGWALLVIAVLGVAEARLLPAIIGNFRLLPSVALGVVAVVWMAGLAVIPSFLRSLLVRQLISNLRERQRVRNASDEPHGETAWATFRF
jgi:hypothetical protein